MTTTASCILAIDQGTTSSRAILFDRRGTALGIAQQEFRQYYPRPGRVEHDPLEIWSSQNAVIRQVMEQTGVRSDNLAAIGITNQRETTVVWDRHTGEPIHPAIVWQDRRTAPLCQQLKKDGFEEILHAKTGLVPDPYFSGTKLAWILDNVRGAREKAEAGDLLFGTIDSWLIWKLTGGKLHATDASNASRTLMMNIHTGDWDDELLDILNIPRAMLPEIRSSSEIYAKVGEDHTLAGVPISGNAGDQQAALFGQACFKSGMAKNTYGTGCFLLMNTGKQPVQSKNNLLTTIAWKIGNETTYALEGSVFIGGAVIQWLRDEMGLISTAAECDQLAATVPDSGGLYIVPAFTGLGAPYWDPDARGIAVGITRGTSKAHFCRAALDSIAFQSAELIHSMEKDSGIDLKALRVDGGASRSDPLLQFQADLLQTEVVRPHCVETTAWGAACLAGLAVGFWDSLDSIADCWIEGNRFTARREMNEVQTSLSQWKQAVQRSLRWNASGS